MFSLVMRLHRRQPFGLSRSLAPTAPIAPIAPIATECPQGVPRVSPGCPQSVRGSPIPWWERCTFIQFRKELQGELNSTGSDGDPFWPFSPPG